MAQTIKLKRSATQGAVPTTTQLELGEVAINTYDGKMYIKKNDGSEAIVEVGSTASLIPSGSDGQIQFNSSGALSATTFVYVDDTNSRLGIGNTTPLSDLHVTGTTTLQSSIDFLSPNESNTITLSMLDSDTLSVSGDSGQLFSITDSLSGTIFAVNDISGVPSIGVDDDGTIRFAETFGNVLVGTATDDGTNKLQVNGGIKSTTINTTGNLVVGGDLTVSGTTTTVNTETINLADNTILLNSNSTGSATEDAGIEIERGDDTNVSFLWDETNDRWTFADKNVFTSGEFQGTATSAQYADLAERYHAGSPVEAGSVVCFGGDNEIEMCNEAGSTRVAGVISTAPAYMMNRDAGDDSTHPYVALAGRVPCKVTGSIRKGDLLHSSAMAGHAEAGEFKGGAMIGKALENFDGESGVIEVLVNLM